MSRFNFFVVSLLYIISVFFKYTPDWIVRFVWSLSSVFSGYISLSVRYCILKSRCKSVGKNVYIGKYVIMKNIENIAIGDNVSIHDYNYLDGYGGIAIGSNVSIAHSTSIISFEHSWDDDNKPIKYNLTLKNEVVISDDVWVGCGVRILSGTYISTRTVISAGSVIKGTLEGNSVFSGMPIKKLKEI